MVTELRTITNRLLKISSNKRSRTFIIKTESGKYKTYPMNKEEFENALYWSGNDWQQFLKTNEYYKV